MLPRVHERILEPVRLGRALPRDTRIEIRRVMELRYFKWDAQVGDGSSLAPYPLLLTSATWCELARLAERLFDETARVEAELLARPSLHARLALPRALRRLFASGAPTPAAARVMRFDFHPTAEGWRVSEVNSDVPGGFTEATNFTSLMAAHVPGTRPAGDPTRAVVDGLLAAVEANSAVALLSAPGHIEDHQVVAWLAASLRARGLDALPLSLHQLRWRARRAEYAARPIGAIYRFYQAEWLPRVAHARQWSPMFVDGCTPVVNPGTSALTESKRLPLIWDELRTAIPTWRRCLPETRALHEAPWTSDDDWLIKSAYGNTGDTVCVRAAMTRRDWLRASWVARLRPGQWLAQRRFSVRPVFDERGPLYPCIGVYVVDGRAAGAYARISRGPVIDGFARDIAVLIADVA
jgi:glutathionylspermidine synthase